MNPERKEEYRRNVEQEQLLLKINAALESVERQMIVEFDAPRKPTLFIVGAPRSATTLVHQLIARTERFGYISNYLARFWLAPYLGALQEKALHIREESDISFESNYGRTRGWAEPHTFHYFWRRWFSFDDDHQMSQETIENIDKAHFTREIAALESVFNRPMLFRSLYCGMQIEFLSRALEHAKFIVCVRDPLYQAQSILLGRKAIFGTYDAWFSLKPSQYIDLVRLSPFKQVAGQIYHILRTIGQGLKLLPPSNYVIIDQEDLTRDPRGVLNSILRLANLVEISEKEAPQRVFENRNKVKLDDGEWRDLKLAIEEYFNDKSSSDILLS